MGGLKSGEWWRWQRKKSTVEESLVISMKDLRKGLFAGAAGSLTWTWKGGNKSSVGFFVTGTDDGPTVHLHYRRADKEDVNIPVRNRKGEKENEVGRRREGHRNRAKNYEGPGQGDDE